MTTTQREHVARRPYDAVATAPAEGGHGVLLDARPLRAPSGTVLVAPTAALAEAIAAEWRAQPARLDIGRAPLTRLLGTARDRIPERRAAVEAELAGYAETELVCHRAAHPPPLVQRQIELWQPLLDWFARDLDAPLTVTTGILPVAQPPASLAAIARTLAGLDACRLTGWSIAVGGAGSLVIGAALACGRIDPGAAFAAAELDASFQIAQWGEDAEAAQRRARVREELDLAARWMALLDA